MALVDYNNQSQIGPKQNNDINRISDRTRCPRNRANNEKKETQQEQVWFEDGRCDSTDILVMQLSL